MIDWLKIRNEYINTSISYRKLADKYGVSFPTLRDRAKKESWSSERHLQRDKIVTKTSQKTAKKIVNAEVNRIEKVLSLNDKITSKLDKAIEQLESVYVGNEIVDTGFVDVDRARKLVSALKDIKEIAGVGDGSGDIDTVRIITDVERDKD